MTMDVAVHNPTFAGYCDYCEDRCEGPGMPLSHYRSNPEPVRQTPIASAVQHIHVADSAFEQPERATSETESELSPKARQRFQDMLLSPLGLEYLMEQNGISDSNELSDRTAGISRGYIERVRLYQEIPSDEELLEDGLTGEEFLDELACALDMNDAEIFAQWNETLPEAARHAQLEKRPEGPQLEMQF